MEQNEKIKQELNQISLLIASIGNRNRFIIPEKYFENLADIVLNKKEKNKISETGLNYSRVSPFIVPENYFINFPDSIIEKAKNDNGSNEVELTIPKGGSFVIDENYFTSFSASLTEKLEAEKCKSELITMENFSIPSNYFEANPDKFLQAAKAVEQQETKVISIFSKSYFKFSAAAAVAAIIIGITFLFKTQPTANINQELTAQDIKCYLQHHTEEVDDLQLTENVVKADEKKTIHQQKIIQSSTEKEKTELKNYLENELDESDLNDAI